MSVDVPSAAASPLGVRDRRPDVLVIGGGVAGVTTAYELALRGRQVALIERGAELAWECSSGNAGYVTWTHAVPLANPTALRQGLRWMWRPESPFYVRPRAAVVPWLSRFVAASLPGRADAAAKSFAQLSRAGVAKHRELSELGLDTGYERRGLLEVYDEVASLDAGRAEIALRAEFGQGGELLDGDGLRRVEPSLAPSLLGGTYYPEEAHCDPLKFVQAVGAAAAGLGVAIHLRTEALAISTDGGRVTEVSTSEGIWNPGEVVLATGAWSPILARDLGLALPVEGGKGYHVEFPSSEATPRVPVFLYDSKVAVTPYPGRVRLSGTLELDGLNLRVDSRRVEAIVAAGTRAFPGISGTPRIHTWRGLRPASPDGLPIVGRVGHLENATIVTGHGQAGMTLAPATAQLAADLICGTSPSFPPQPFAAQRFTLGAQARAVLGSRGAR